MSMHYPSRPFYVPVLVTYGAQMGDPTPQRRAIMKYKAATVPEPQKKKDPRTVFGWALVAFFN